MRMRIPGSKLRLRYWVDLPLQLTSKAHQGKAHAGESPEEQHPKGVEDDLVHDVIPYPSTRKGSYSLIQTIAQSG